MVWVVAVDDEVAAGESGEDFVEDVGCVFALSDVGDLAAARAADV